MKLTKRQLKRIIREEKQKLQEAPSWAPSDEEYDAAEQYIDADCMKVLRFVQRSIFSDSYLYEKATMEDFLLECIEWIKRENIDKNTDISALGID